MKKEKYARAEANCYVIALSYAALASLILILRNKDFTDVFTFLYAGNAFGLTLLFLSFPQALRKESRGAHRAAMLLNIASFLCFLLAITWLIVATVQWYENDITLTFRSGSLYVYIGGLALSLGLLLGKATKLGKDFRERISNINKTVIRNFITASVILTYLQLSFLFKFDIVTHLAGMLAFAVIMGNQLLATRKWFLRQRKHVTIQN